MIVGRYARPSARRTRRVPTPGRGRCHDGRSPQGATNSGGNDTISGSDNDFELIGDVYEVAGNQVGGFTFSAVYDAGNDTITSGPSSGQGLLIGDAQHVDAFGTLNGGDDTIDNSLNVSDASVAMGDAYFQLGGTVNGGDDTIAADGSAVPETAGDIVQFSAGVLNGGDTITA